MSVSPDDKLVFSFKALQAYPPRAIWYETGELAGWQKYVFRGACRATGTFWRIRVAGVFVFAVFRPKFVGKRRSRECNLFVLNDFLVFVVRQQQ